MKALAIVSLLAAVILAALFLLLSPSNADIRRIEDEAAALLEEASAALSEATGILNALRVVKPTILVLDNDLNGLRAQAETQLRQLDELRGERPDAGDYRGGHIERRKAARQAAQQLCNLSQGLVERARLIEAFLRDTQPRVQLMLARFGELYALRNRMVQQGKKIDAALLTKIDYLQEEVQRKQSLARSVLDVGARDAREGTTLRETAAREIELLIAEVEALARLLASD
ncbi:MAG: hypothetical protein HY812_15720 [Planctomycetes bacterium]|nr:hypothetical protein [Planctomycetota bacterium]